MRHIAAIGSDPKVRSAPATTTGPWGARFLFGLVLVGAFDRWAPPGTAVGCRAKIPAKRGILA